MLGTALIGMPAEDEKLTPFRLASRHLWQNSENEEAEHCIPAPPAVNAAPPRWKRKTSAARKVDKRTFGG